MTQSSPNPAAPTAAAAAIPAVEVAQQLRRFLELGATQLRVAIKESDERVAKLSDAVTAVATESRSLANLAAAMRSGETRGDAAAQLAAVAATLTAHVSTMINTMQFYDKLIQRLTHVTDGLAIPAERLAHPSRLGTLDWDATLDAVRDCYSMAEERVMFDLVVKGLDSTQMLKGLTSLRAAVKPGELELF